MFPEAKPSGTLRVEGKQDSLFLEGPFIKCIVKASAKARNNTQHCWAQQYCLLLRDVSRCVQTLATSRNMLGL